MEKLETKDLLEQKKRQNNLKEILRCLDTGTISNEFYFFEELGWSFESHKDLYLYTIQVGFYEVIEDFEKKLKMEKERVYSESTFKYMSIVAGSMGHVGSRIGLGYIDYIKPNITSSDNERVVVIGDAVIKIMAILYEIDNNLRRSLIYYEALGNTEKVSELSSKKVTKDEIGTGVYYDDPRWKKAVEEFSEVVEKYTITKEERDHYVENIRQVVEQELKELQGMRVK